MKKAIPEIIVVLICSIAAISLSLVTYGTAFERASIYVWRGNAYQIVTAVLGCTAFVATIRIMVSSKSKSSIASLLPLASLPAWMGLFGMVCHYRTAYYVCYTASSTPRFDDLMAAHVYALSYLMIGLAAAFPACMAIAIALYVRTLRGR